MINEAAILGANILIVDDQEANVMLLEQLLADAGYTHVTSTQNPQEVCALHRKNAYDLILLDLQMPGSYLPVIVLTAQPGHKLRALQSGAKDFISKPFDLVEVKTRIRNMLEVRLLYKKMGDYARLLELAVQERTAELRESEARFRSLTQLATDWYWEQDENGHFTKVSGPVLDMLGMQVETLADEAEPRPAAGWNAVERDALRTIIAQRQPFLDYLLHRALANGSQQQFRVSGEPMFTQSGRFRGYRGVGVEVGAKR